MIICAIICVISFASFNSSDNRCSFTISDAINNRSQYRVSRASLRAILNLTCE